MEYFNLYFDKRAVKKNKKKIICFGKLSARY